MPALSLRPSLERRLKRAVSGEVLGDAFSRGRYATDASAYQMMPAAVVVPETAEDVAAALAIAREEGLTVTPRGGGTSQCGQTINSGLVIDFSKNLNNIIELDVAGRRAVVEPGLVLDELNRVLSPHGLWFPVDVSTASRATIGGMAGNNSCGTRSLRYGTMRDNVIAIDGLLADGTALHFNGASVGDNNALFADLLALGAAEAEEIRARFPDVLRRVGGYNLDALMPAERGGAGRGQNNLSHILVGSEGTLALSTRIEIALAPKIGPKAVGVCHFGRFYEAMDAAQHLVTLNPIAVELVDRTMIGLARNIAIYRPTVERFVRGEPDALLLVEFAEATVEDNRRKLRDLEALVGDLGFGWDKSGAKWGGVIPIEDPNLQAAITEVRQSGLNIMMSMKDDGKPVSFVEDCAVPLVHLAEYTDRLTQVFEKHGTRGTWYAHASVGCLHVRPILNLKLDKDLRAMRAIAEEAFALVREYKGSHSGEHGDGIVRSEFHEQMFGSRMVAAFEAVKDRFDPSGLLNPGKIVRAPKMDDRRLLRYGPDYQPSTMKPALSWQGFPGGAGGLQGAVEMCNNNGACRKLQGGVMCPSYRVTRDEKDVVRGRANTLRLAISGQLGADALGSDDMLETMKLCVSCKGCRRECPTGVDMAKMKIEVLAAANARRGLSMRDRVVGFLPRYAPYAARVSALINFADRLPGSRFLRERLFGFSARRALPQWAHRPYRPSQSAIGAKDGAEVVLFADTFNTYYEPENLRAAAELLAGLGYRVRFPQMAGERPLCCGRTFLSAGLVDEARAEAARFVQAMAPFVARGVPIIGLEPSCLLSLRDEFAALIPGPGTQALEPLAFLLEEFLAKEAKAGRLTGKFRAGPKKALLHGHCHQKAFGAVPPVIETLKLIPGLDVELIETSCCGMAGAFGYGAETFDVSMKMAELSLLPKVRAAEPDVALVADGFSCRHQIHDGSGRAARHAVHVLRECLIEEDRAPHSVA